MFSLVNKLALLCRVFVSISDLNVLLAIERLFLPEPHNVGFSVRFAFGTGQLLRFVYPVK